MYSLENYVETLQQTKKRITDKVITDATLNKAAHNYIDAQTAFAKMMIGNTQTVVKQCVDKQTSFWFPGKELK